MYIFSFRILFVCKTSHTPPWLCKHATILILLWFMFHSLHISKAACTDLQPTSRLVNSSLEILLHLGQLCSTEDLQKMMGFKTASMATQQKFAPSLGQDWAKAVICCSASRLILLDFHSSHLHHGASIHWQWQTSFPHPLLPLSPVFLSQPTSFAQLGSSQRWILQALVYEWYRQHFGNLSLRANFLLHGTPAFNSRERKQPPQ